MGCTFHEHILRIFFNGWMDCRGAFYAALYLYYCCVTVAEYEVYWLVDAPIINPLDTYQPFFLLKWYAQINQSKLLCF